MARVSLLHGAKSARSDHIALIAAFNGWARALAKGDFSLPSLQMRWHECRYKSEQAAYHVPLAPPALHTMHPMHHILWTDFSLSCKSPLTFMEANKYFYGKEVLKTGFKLVRVGTMTPSCEGMHAQ